MNYSKEKDEIDYAYKIRRAMNESTETIPQATLDRLAQSRQIALSRKKEAVPTLVFALSGVLAGNAGSSSFGSSNWLKKASLLIPLIALAAGLYGIYHFEQEQQIQDLAEIDAAVLVDELPPDAYLDEGFNAYLNKKEQEEKN